MSAAESQWPAWLRRRLPVERLGSPKLFFARLTIALSFLTMIFVGSWNAAKYPIVLGYDMQPNAAYAHILLDERHIPRPDQTAEARQPPGYYFVAEVAARAGHKLFGWLEARPYSAQLPEASYRGAQILNTVLVLGTALILLALARIVAPNRPDVWAASVAFFAFLPVVSKTAAMFHPETLNMFISAAAILVTTRIAQSRRLGMAPVALLVATLAAGFLVRASTLFTLIAVVIGLAVVFGSSAVRGQLSKRTRRIALAALGAVTVLGLLLVNRAPDLVQGLTQLGGSAPASVRADYPLLDLVTMFRSPYRPHILGQALPVTYVEIWADWIGAFAWSPFTGTPSPTSLSVMKDQVWIGVVPTLLAIAGVLLLALRVVKGRRELTAVVALPLVALIGYLFRSYQVNTADGDVLKASYLLTTAPFWSLGFGVAFAALGRYPRLRFGIGACLVVFGVLELRFMLYGIRDGHSIF